MSQRPPPAGAYDDGDEEGRPSLGGEQSPPQPAGPIVFQCAACRRVVGDSLALVHADEELSNITLHGACGIVRSPCTRTSEGGKDQGSTYHELFCQGCNAPLGKVYLTTAVHLDPLRNLFTFDTEALESYQLGKYDHALELPEHLRPPAEEEAAAAATEAQQQQPPAQVQMELTKLQNMMLVFHDRISALERALKAATGGGSGALRRKSSSGGGSGSGGGGAENSPASGNKRKKR